MISPWLQSHSARFCASTPTPNLRISITVMHETESNERHQSLLELAERKKMIMQQIQELKQQLQEKGQQLQEKDQQLQEKDQQLQERHQQIQERDQQIQDYYR
ncbi:hypothetical protein E4U50_008375, partial [Claviceps purpurea]